MIDAAGHAHTGDLGEAPAGDAHVVGIGVRGIPLRGTPGAPALVRGQRRREVVPVFTLCIDDFSQYAGSVQLPHVVEIFVEVRGLEHHVAAIGSLGRGEERIRILQ